MTLEENLAFDERIKNLEEKFKQHNFHVDLSLLKHLSKEFKELSKENKELTELLRR